MQHTDNKELNWIELLDLLIVVVVVVVAIDPV
jgi:hypothetical protein